MKSYKMDKIRSQQVHLLKCMRYIIENKMSYLQVYGCVSRSFRTGRLERELQMLQLHATRCSCIAIL
jgi:hypothetical protein